MSDLMLLSSTNVRSDRDGKVTLNELLEFAVLCAQKRRDFKEHEFTMQLQVNCSSL